MDLVASAGRVRARLCRLKILLQSKVAFGKDVYNALLSAGHQRLRSGDLQRAGRCQVKVIFVQVRCILRQETGENRSVGRKFQDIRGIVSAYECLVSCVEIDVSGAVRNTASTGLPDTTFSSV